MKSEERRKAIAEILLKATAPVSGGELAKKLSVSRQIIVGDIAKLKSQGFEILPTHNGYILQKPPYSEAVFKVRHTSNQTEDELLTVIALGGMVVDVFVWHKIYGRISATLNIFTKQDVSEFLEGIKSGKSTELMHITAGYHYHTVRAENDRIIENIRKALEEKDYLAPGV